MMMMMMNCNSAGSRGGRERGKSQAKNNMHGTGLEPKAPPPPAIHRWLGRLTWDPRNPWYRHGVRAGRDVASTW